ncbi:MAG: hypothetical protein HY028_08745 [Gammaproteobacteria bacterium]|nr:hypothetical protein [Gammaproteobacteria bacterium]
MDNPLLEEPLKPEHIKPRLLGHWGTAPGITREEGATTTPFDMHIRNRTSRYHLVIQAARRMAACHPHFSMQAEALIVEYERKLADHRTFILREGLDPPEINDWRRRD